jgi:hypothetical protein
MFEKWTIPTPIPVDWKMREVDSAVVHVGAVPDGRFEQKIDHAVLPDITPKMLLWWIRNLDRQIEWDGSRFLAYRLWHPRDHIFHRIFPRSDGDLGPGMKFHLVEAFGADLKYLVDHTFEVTKFDESGFRLEMSLLGQTVFALNETFSVLPGGTKCTVQMVFESTNPAFQLAAKVVRMAEADFLHRWIQHNVEEVGNYPFFLPQIYEKYQGNPLPLG